MDDDSDPRGPRPPRKHRFAPKPQAGRKPKAAAASGAKKEDADVEAEVQRKLQRFNEGALRKQRREVEDKPPANVAFMHGPNPPTAPGASSVPRDGGHTQSRGLGLKKSHEGRLPSYLKAEHGERKESDADSSLPETKTEYREPWDYVNTYYCTTLPWRPPYSGDPEILDEAEFGEASTKQEYDENSINSAAELGFLDCDETGEDDRLLFFNFQPPLPLLKKSSSAKGKEKVGAMVAPDPRVSMMGEGREKEGSSGRCFRLEELPAGQIGKLQVYKSGAVKLKIGDILYVVSPGSEGNVCREVVGVDTKEKGSYSIGELHKRVVVTPNIEHLLDSVL